MKKLLLSLFAVFMMTTAMAQSPFGGMNFDPKEIAARRTEEMTEKFKLSKEQAEKVAVLNVDFFTNLFKDGFPPMTPPQTSQDGKPSFGPDMTNYNKELKTILSKEQFKAYEEDHAKRMAEMEKRMKEFMPR